MCTAPGSLRFIPSFPAFYPVHEICAPASIIFAPQPACRSLHQLNIYAMKTTVPAILLLASCFFILRIPAFAGIPGKDSTARDTAAFADAAPAGEIILFAEQATAGNNVFADPSGRTLSILLKPSRKNTIRITDAAHKQVFTAVSSGRMQVIDLSAFIPGTYTISVNNRVLKKLQLTR